MAVSCLLSRTCNQCCEIPGNIDRTTGSHAAAARGYPVHFATSIRPSLAGLFGYNTAEENCPISPSHMVFIPHTIFEYLSIQTRIESVVLRGKVCVKHVLTLPSSPLRLVTPPRYASLRLVSPRKHDKFDAKSQNSVE